MTAERIDRITGYHAHVYFDEGSEPAAATLRAAIEAEFEVTMGRWHRKPVGPHPHWSYQVAFSTELFGAIVPFLLLKRGGLTVLVHPNTDDSYADHFDRAIWLGEKLALDPAPLSRDQEPSA
jgi:aromatic ring-cleaving dioxygenase